MNGLFQEGLRMEIGMFNSTFDNKIPENCSYHTPIKRDFGEGTHLFNTISGYAI
jgi:hypothetical protein